MRLFLLRASITTLILLGTASVLPASAQDATSTATATPTPTPTLTPTPIVDLKAFEIYPKGQILGDYFAPTIESGESADLVVVLANTGNVPFKGRTYAVDAMSAINGGFTVADSGTEPTGVTLWLDYSEEVYTIEPGTGLERTFKVTIPEGTAPGQYITALVLEDAEAVNVDDSQNFQQIIRFPVPVFITVPGPFEPAFEIGDIVLTTNEAVGEIEIQIVNAGNIRVRPAGTVTILDGSGRELYNVPVTMGSVYARDQTALRISLPAKLPEGVYTVQIDLTDPETKVGVGAEAEITAAESAGTPVASTGIQILDATGTPRPDLNGIQFLEVSVTIDNRGEPLTNGQVVLRVSRDGDPVENFPIASSLSLSGGETTVSARYIPVTGWEEGTWTFEISIEAVATGSGVAEVLARTDLDSVRVSK